MAAQAKASPSTSNRPCDDCQDCHDHGTLFGDIKKAMLAIHLAASRMGGDGDAWDHMHLIDKKVNVGTGTSITSNQLVDRPMMITAIWAVFPANSGGGVLTIGTDAIPVTQQNAVFDGLQMIVGANEFFSLTTPANISGAYYLRIMGYAMKSTGWMVDR